jgi:hypothetical protein
MKLAALVAFVFVLLLICGATVHPIFATLAILVLGIYLIYCLFGFFSNLVKRSKNPKR